MSKNIKHLLDETIPNDITLSEDNKQKILQKANTTMQRLTSPRKRLFRPIFSTIAIIGLLIILISPSLLDRLSSYKSFETPLEKVTIPNVDYSSLIRSIFIKDTNELIFAANKTIYSYSLISHSQQVLVESKKDIDIYTMAANENWLVWGEGNDDVYILDRKTQMQPKQINIVIGDIHLKENKMIYSDSHGYKWINLTTMEEGIIHENVGIGRNSKADLYENFLVIPEQLKTNNSNATTFYVYDITTLEQIGKYGAPYKSAENVTLADNRIYSSFSNEDETPSTLGYIDLSDGEFHKIKTPSFHTYAIYKNYIALSVKKNNTDTVKLYQLEDKSLRELPIFNKIKERLVVPRFTDDGALIVNGESADFTLYIQDME
jgi:hypothetical protein